MNFDIAIAYRCYPGVSKTPLFYSDNKLAMILNGLKSMRLCLGNLRAKFFILDDGCPESFEASIREVLSGLDIEYIRTGKIGNFGTYKRQLEILSTQNDAEVVYLAEDDYLYSLSGFSEGIEILTENRADFVTLFDHRSHYVARHHSVKSNFILTGSRIWKSVPSTCLTFMTTKKTLNETKNVLLLFTRKCWDYPMWLILTKYNIFRVFDVAFSERLYGLPVSWFHVIMAWIYGWKHILFGHKYRLYAPVPSIATHLESEDIAPLVDWSKVREQIENTNA